MDVINQKYREIRNVLSKYDVDGIELDFSRTPCFFKKKTPYNMRKARMSNLISRVIRDRNYFETLNNRPISLIVRLPADEDLDKLGLPLLELAETVGIDALIIGKQNPTNSSQSLFPEVLKNRKANPNLQVFYELYQVSDSMGTVRRPASKAELYTAAYEAIRAGYDGLSLFNFHYANNAMFFPRERLNWDQDISCLRSQSCLKDIRPTYFFSMRSADISKTSDANFVTHSLKFNAHDLAHRFGSSIYLRINFPSYFDLSADHRQEWNQLRLEVEINGKKQVKNNGQINFPLNMKSDISFFPKFSNDNSFNKLQSMSHSKILTLPSEVLKKSGSGSEVTLKVKIPKNQTTKLNAAGMNLSFQITTSD